MVFTDEDYRMAFETALTEHGFTFKVDTDDMYSITQVDKPDPKAIVKLICSGLINEKIHGSIKNTEIKAIGYFKFKLSHEGIEPNFYIFAFSNKPDKKVEFVIVPAVELKNRLSQRKCITDNSQKTELKFWLLPDNLLFETTNFGAEGEWWFIGCRMAKNTHWDYTMFLNGWDILAKS